MTLPACVRCVYYNIHMRCRRSRLPRALAVRAVSMGCFRGRGRDLVRYRGGCRYRFVYHIDFENAAMGDHAPLYGDCQVRREIVRNGGEIDECGGGRGGVDL